MFHLLFRPYLPGFRVDPLDNIPGFNVPMGGIPGFNVDEDGIAQEETTWTVQTEPPDPEESTESTPSQLPDLLNKLGSMRPPGVSATRVSDVEQWPPSNAFQQPSDTLVGAEIAIGHDANSRRLNKATWNRSLLPTNRSAPVQRAGSPNPWIAGVMRQHIGFPSMPAVRPIVALNSTRANDLAADNQPALQTVALPDFQQRQSLAPFGTAMMKVGMPGRANMDVGGFARELGQTSPQPMRASGPPTEVVSSVDDAKQVGQTNTQVQTPQALTQINLPRRDAAGLPVGTIISSIRTNVGGIALDGLNIHLVGDGDTVENLPRNERHERGIDASIADHLAKGFELVVRGSRAVDVPGFSEPRYYDYIIRDPVTGQNYGVEVKTTIIATIRLNRSQVEKDAAVIAGGAKVRVLGIDLNGVSYSTYCFGCEAFDVRSAVLLSILKGAGVPVTYGTLPGDIRP